MNYREDYLDEYNSYEKDKEKAHAASHLNTITKELDQMRFLTDLEKKYLRIALKGSDISIKQIAEILGIPVSSTYDLKNRTARKLKKHLGL